MEDWGTIVAAIIGGAGVSGLLGGLVQFSRLSRSARPTDHMTKALKDMPQGAASDALCVALERERLLLAAIAMIRTPPIKWVLYQLATVMGPVVLVVVYGAATDSWGSGATPEISRTESILRLVSIALAFLIGLALLATSGCSATGGRSCEPPKNLAPTLALY
jgi:hypothetical protein